MRSTHSVGAKLENYTNGEVVEWKVKNNRQHYWIEFDEDVGHSWLYGQVMKLSDELDENSLEPWKIRTGKAGRFILDVREHRRRPGIDEDQNSLFDFEQE